MSESRMRKRSDYWAGVCVLSLGAVVLFITSMIAYVRANPLGTVHFRVLFDVGNGVEGVLPGSPIYYGGIDIGQVESVHYQGDELEVGVAVDRTVRLHPGVQIRREGSLMGGPSSLVVTLIGDTRADPLRSGTKIRASPPIGGTTSLLGAANASRLKRIESSIANAVKGLDAVGSQIGEVGETGTALTDVAKRIQEDFERWNPQFKDIETRLERISGKLDTLEADVDPVKVSAREVSDATMAIQKRFDGPAWEKLRNDVDELMIAVRKTADEFQEQVIPHVEQVMDKAEASWTHLLTTAEALKQLAAHGKQSIDVFIANSTLAAEQLILAEDEVLGSLGLPLLEHPSAADQDLLIRQEAMGAWARAALELRELLSALETIKLDDQADADAEAALAELLDALRNTLAEYEQAQQRLFESTDSKNGTK